jgi:hypothetical protein
MKGSDVHVMSRLAECMIVRNMPAIKKKLMELQYMAGGCDTDKKIAEIREEINKAIENLQTIQLGLE